MYTTKCLIQFNTHHAHITVNEDRISVFKYNNTTCDMYVFNVDQQYEASDYIIQALPSSRYAVTFPGED